MLKKYFKVKNNKINKFDCMFLMFLNSFFNFFRKRFSLSFNKKLKKENTKYKRKTILKLTYGFMIIETMIAVSVFSIIITIGTASLLNASLLHDKSQDMRSIIDSLSFAMEDMSRNLRTGYNYHCIDDGNLNTTNTYSCINGGAGISFKSSFGTQWVYVIAADGSIQKSVSGGSGPFIALTPSEVRINKLSSFTIVGAEPPPADTNQPFIIIRLEGTVTSKKGDITTSFSLQTGVSQRMVDVAP